jgi:hypothetical protein
MGAWTEALRTYIKNWYLAKMRRLTEAIFAELIAAERHEKVCALSARDSAILELRDLQNRTWRITKWMEKDWYASSICLGDINKMDSLGDLAPVHHITLVRNTNEFRFIHDYLKQGERGNPTSTNGVHPARKWNIKDFLGDDE